MKKQRGITLVALVITIIVLLILAGVSISLVVGNNGVLTQASNAVIANKEAQAKEELAMAWSSATTKYWSDWVNNSTIRMSDYLTKEALDPYFSDGHLVEDPVFNDGIYTARYEIGGAIYTLQIDATGHATNIGTTYVNSNPGSGVAASAVAAAPATYFGKTVNYSADGLSDWKIFYADSSNIFLVKSDYLSKEKIPAATGMSSTGTIQAYWTTAPAAQTVTSAVKSSFKWDLWTDYSTKEIGRCVSTLLNTGNWTGLVNTTYADYAIGSPTLEMWIASWNARYPGDTLYCNNVGERGYYVGTTSSPTTPYITSSEMKDREGYGNDLYYLYPSLSGVKHEGVYGYWLASPAEANDYTNYIMRVDCYGNISCNAFTADICALRPVVRLKNTTTLTTGTDGYDYNLTAN